MPPRRQTTARSTPRSRRNDPARAHAIVLNPPADQYQYDITKSLPPCPDEEPTGDFELRGRLWEGRFEKGRAVDHRVRAYPSRGAIEGQVRALRETMPTLVSMNFGGKRKVKFRESTRDYWSYGLDQMPYTRGPTAAYIPLLPGPATRQLYWSDYFAMSAKAFEAYQHNPLAHRSVEIGTEFVIGRGVEAVAKTELGQKAWDAWWERNGMDARLEEILGDLATYGEVMLRYFRTLAGLVPRSLDPAGIYDIITDQEDWETVYFYHQQEQERMQLFAPGDAAGTLTPPSGVPTEPQAVTRYTIRQIPAEEIDHYRLNVRSAEVRGRSDLFPALGYLKRLQDLLTSKVVRSDMEARMVFDLMVKGNASDVEALRNTIFPGGRPPEPGAIVAHNDMSELTAMAFQGGARGEDTTVDEIVEMVANGVGVSRQYLWTAGKSGGTARAGALIATEPGQKRFERRQRVCQRMLHDMARRVFEEAGLSGEDAEIEFIFPSIAVEERSATLKDIAFAESMDWISKETAAKMNARQLDIETFDYDDEQAKIASEFEKAQEDEGDEDEGKPPTYDAAGVMTDPGVPAKKATPKQGDGVIRRPMVSAQYRQVPKLDPTKTMVGEDDPPGLLMGGPEEGGAGPAGADPRAPGRSGIPGDENALTQAGKANIRRDAGGGAKVRESDPTLGGMVPIEDLLDVVRMGFREAALAGARVPRRRPQDPEFRDESDAYNAQTRRNVADLRRAVRTGGS
jgi:hypothetical protein